jgi:hypothetical protein
VCHCPAPSPRSVQAPWLLQPTTNPRMAAAAFRCLQLRTSLRIMNPESYCHHLGTTLSLHTIRRIQEPNDAVEPSGRLRGLEIEGRPELTGPGAGAAVGPEFASFAQPVAHSLKILRAHVLFLRGSNGASRGDRDLTLPRSASVYLCSLITSLPFPHNSRSFKHQ